MWPVCCTATGWCGPCDWCVVRWLVSEYRLTCVLYWVWGAWIMWPWCCTVIGQCWLCDLCAAMGLATSTSFCCDSLLSLPQCCSRHFRCSVAPVSHSWISDTIQRAPRFLEFLYTVYGYPVDVPLILFLWSLQWFAAPGRHSPAAVLATPRVFIPSVYFDASRISPWPGLIYEPPFPTHLCGTRPSPGVGDRSDAAHTSSLDSEHIPDSWERQHCHHHKSDATYIS